MFFSARKWISLFSEKLSLVTVVRSSDLHQNQGTTYDSLGCAVALPILLVGLLFQNGGTKNTVYTRLKLTSATS